MEMGVEWQGLSREFESRWERLTKAGGQASFTFYCSFEIIFFAKVCLVKEGGGCEGLICFM